MQLTSSEALAHRVIEILSRQGYRALLVGGCVRDLLLGKQPKDWDVATDAVPAQILTFFPDANLVGAQFGVVLVRDGNEAVEVATFRSDGEYRDGRRPEQVRYEKDPREDAMRRDFTINGLFMNDAEAVIDYVGGRDDLRAGLIRAIGDPEQRFCEDQLRLLRAVRFAARLGFHIEPVTWKAVQKLAPEVRTVAMERVRDELTRILTEGGARRGFELLDASGLLAELLPEVAAMKGVEQPPQYHPEGDVWVHTLMVLESLESPTPTLAWAALLHDAGKPPTFRIAGRIRFDGHAEVGVEIASRILARLRFPKDQSEQIERLIADHMKFKDVRAMRESTLKRFVRQPDFEEHLALHRADCLSSNGNLEAYTFVKNKLADLPDDQLKPAPLLTGRDLIKRGYVPGPRFSEILTAVEDAQLEGSLASKEDALRFVHERFPQARS